MRLSDRLNAVIGLAGKADCLADVGCDHGFISIELINRGISKKMIAMDVREGPLSRAKEHILQCNMHDVIETRLSDGVQALKVNEADGMIIAGMGGNLVIHILEQGKEIISGMQQCVLQPQSEIAKVRKYLRDNNFQTVAEDMVFEDGKYYPMMKVVPNRQNEIQSREIFDLYGEFLLRENNSVLKKYLNWQIEKKNQIIENLSSDNEIYNVRITEIKKEKSLALEALEFMKKQQQ